MKIKRFNQLNENIDIEGNKVVITKDGMTYGELATLTGIRQDNKYEVKFDSGFVGYYKSNEFVDENTFNNKFDYNVEYNNLKHQYNFAKDELEKFENKLKSEGVVFNENGEFFPNINKNIFK